MSDFLNYYPEGGYAYTPTFSAGHLFWIGYAIVIWTVVPLIVKKFPQTKEAILRFLAIFMISLEIFRTIWAATTWPNARFGTIAPFDLCGFMIFICAFTVFYRTQFLMNLDYTLGLTAAIFGVLTPNVIQYPAFSFYYINGILSHSNIVLVVIIFIVGGDFIPNIKYLPKMVLILLIFTLVMIAPLDYFFDTNWFFLAHAPAGTPIEIFDNLVGWPWYNALVLLLGCVLWTLFYLPFTIYRKKKGLGF